MSQITAIQLIFYPSTKRKGDLDNKATSVLDLLTDDGIIPDDNWYAVPELNLKFGGKDKDNPRCEITIYEQVHGTTETNKNSQPEN